MLVCGESRARIESLHEQYNQVDRRKAFSVSECMRRIFVVFAVLLKYQAVLIHRVNDGGACVDEVDFIIQREPSAVNRTHSSRADNSYSHSENSLIPSIA